MKTETAYIAQIYGANNEGVIAWNDVASVLLEHPTTNDVLDYWKKINQGKNDRRIILRVVHEFKVSP